MMTDRENLESVIIQLLDLINDEIKYSKDDTRKLCLLVSILQCIDKETAMDVMSKWPQRVKSVNRAFSIDCRIS